MKCKRYRRGYVISSSRYGTLLQLMFLTKKIGWGIGRMPFEPRATVYTWGTEFGASDYGHGLKAKIRGENVGHASIALQFALNERGKQLIEKYCAPNNIPYDLKRLPTGEEYYEVYFSYWPGINKYTLGQNLQNDQIKERKGVHFNWRNEFLSDTELEIDKRGKKTLGPDMRIHNIPNNNPMLKKLLQDYAFYTNQYRKVENDLWKINREMKIAEKKHAPKEILEGLQAKKEQIITKKLNIQDKLYSIESELKEKEIPLDKYLVIGTPSTKTVEIPVVDGNHSSIGRKGLDLEGMLQGMVKVIKNKNGYNFYGNNCSAAVATAIHGGIPQSDKKLKEKFKTEGFLKITSPQTVYHAALKGQNYLYSLYLKKPQKSILHKFMQFLKGIARQFQSEKPKPKMQK